MNKKMMLKIFIMTACMLIILGSVSSTAASKSIKAGSEAELIEALKGDTDQVVFATGEAVSIVIPDIEGSVYKDLVINAPAAAIVNNSVYASVTLKAVSSYTEKASGNTYTIKAAGIRFRLYARRSVRKITIGAKEAEIVLGKKTNVDEIICSKKSSKINITAYAGAKANVYREKNAGITVKGSTKASITIDRADSPWNDIPVEQYSIDYWKDRLGNNRVILSDSEIAGFNSTNRTNGSGLVDLLKEKEYTVEEVKTMIEDYSFPSKEYVHERKITEEEKEAIYTNRNLDVVPDVYNVKYALATENASIRAFPTDIFLTNEKNLYDYLQETGINYGEPLVVLWESKDDEWYFVQAYDYNGWIRKDSVGLCSRDEYINVVSAFFECNVWCPKNSGEIEFVLGDGTKKNIFLRIGTYMLVQDGKIQTVERDKNGNAVFIPVEMPSDIDGSILPFTSENLLELAGNMLTTPYSWGDSEEYGMDCSSSLQSLYRCFGILLPRNSSQQIKVAAEIVNLSEKSRKEKYDEITDLPLGSILYMPGHVMMYLGTYDGVPYIIQNTTDSARDDGGVIMYNSFVLTSINIGKSGNTLLDRVTYAVVFQNK